MIPVTVIILAYNEEKNIARCLDALRDFDDIAIVDSGSSDKTKEILKNEFPRVRCYTNPFEDFGQQRNWAIDHAEPRHEWILFVDADEFMEPPLAEEIESFVRSNSGSVGGFIAGRNYFLGRWLKNSTFYPSYQLRLLKRGEVRYKKEGHGQREVTTGKLVYLKNPWHHEGFSQGIFHWIARHNHYSSGEIELIQRLQGEKLAWSELVSPDPIRRRRAVKVLGAKLPGLPVTRFLYTYILRRGFLDGYPGLVFCLLRFAHDCHIVAKLAEVKSLRRESATGSFQESHSSRPLRKEVT